MKTIVLTPHRVQIITHTDNYNVSKYIEETFILGTVWQSYNNDVSITPQVISLPEDLPEELSFGEHIDMINEMIMQDGDDVTDEECLNQIVEYVQKHFK